MVASVRNLALLVLFAAAVVGSSAKNTYQVLDSFGWSIPNGGAATYTAWAANKSFTVGDTLGKTHLLNTVDGDVVCRAKIS